MFQQEAVGNTWDHRIPRKRWLAYLHDITKENLTDIILVSEEKCDAATAFVRKTTTHKEEKEKGREK